MKNRDMPIAPLLNGNGGVSDLTGWQEGYYHQKDRSFAFGLTKREHFAAMAMQGLLSNSCLNEGAGFSGNQISQIAVDAADSLLKQLEEGSND